MPEVRILQGNVLIRMRKFGSATKVFRRTRDEYGPQYAELRRIMDSQAGPLPYLEELLGRAPAQGGPRLPRLAALWAREQPEAQSALDLLRDVEQLERDLQESTSILDQIEHAMRGSGRVRVFPDLALGYERAAKLVARLSGAQGRLLSLYRALAGPHASPDERRDLERLARERESLEKRGRSWPRSTARSRAQDKEAKAGYAAASRRLAAVSLQLKGLRSQLAAVEKYAAETRVDEEETESFRQQAEGIRALITTLATEEERLRAAIAEGERSVDEAREAGGDDARREYEQVAAEERRRLNALADRLDVRDRARQGRIEEVLKSATAVRATLDRFGVALEERIEKRLKGISDVVDEERAALAKRRGEIKALASEARVACASAARASFDRVLQRYYDIAVMGDVGLLDVAWARKQERSDAVSQLVNEQKSEYRLLDDGFEELMEETE